MAVFGPTDANEAPLHPVRHHSLGELCRLCSSENFLTCSVFCHCQCLLLSLFEHVPRARFELARPFGHQPLKLARLPLRHLGIATVLGEGVEPS